MVSFLSIQQTFSSLWGIQIVGGVVVLALLVKMSRPPLVGFPPGEWGLPVIGVAVQAQYNNVYGYIEKLRKKYGDIFFMKIGDKLFVVLSDYGDIKTLMHNPDAQGRPRTFSFEITTQFINKGTIFSEGFKHLHARRFTMQYLKDFGMGKSTSQDIVVSEIIKLQKELDKLVGIPTPTDMLYALNVAVLNVIWNMVSAKQFGIADKEIQDYCHDLHEESLISQGPIQVYDVFPWLEKVTPTFIKNKIMKIDVLKRIKEKRSQFFMKSIKEHQETLDYQNPRDLLDCYLIEVENQKNKSEVDFDLLDICINIDNLFVAGMDTVSSTLCWIINYMCMYPEVQRKCHDLIDEVIGRDSLPSMEDRDSLLYVEAVIHEVHRKATIAQLSGPRRTTKDIQINGYTIPKDSLILPNALHCHRSSKYWEKPNEFYPEHFLNDQGWLITKKDGFLPFSVGKRRCLGEALARTELFLFTVSILQRYIIKAAPGEQPTEDSDPTQLILRQVKPFKILLSKRG